MVFSVPKRNKKLEVGRRRKKVSLKTHATARGMGKKGHATTSVTEHVTTVTYVSHQVFEGAGLDGPLAVLVQGPECHPDHVLVIDCPHLGRHHVAELRELDLTGPVRVVLKVASRS